ncbi:hypothetical protein [Komagataeibacter kakiaceti]|nr:hypothetical protein [Komagataeibacter kakiaceti]
MIGDTVGAGKCNAWRLAPYIGRGAGQSVQQGGDAGMIGLTLWR